MRLSTRLRRLPVLILAVSALLAVDATPAAACPTANVMPNAATPAQIRAGVLCVINAQRARVGRRALVPNGLLTTAAQGWANRRVFSHGNPGARIRAAGYRARSFGETLAYDCGANITPAAIVNRWMNSGLHRGIILSARLRDAGIGFVLWSPNGCSPGAMYVGNFGVR